MPLFLAAGAAPLYVQLKEALRHHITTNLQPGDRLPSEPQLIEEYGLSRTTVRLALGALTNEGLIVRSQGRGSFVAEPKRTVPVSPPLLVRPTAPVVVTRLVSVDDTTPAPEISSAMGISSDLLVQRVRWIERYEEAGDASCYRVGYLLPDLVAGLDLEQVEDLESIRTLLSNRVEERGARPSVTARFTSVVLADPFRASMLDVAEGTPLIRVETTLQDEAGTPLEVSRAYYGGHSLRVQLN